MRYLRLSLLLLIISSCATKRQGIGNESYIPSIRTITYVDTQIVTEIRSFDTIISISDIDTIIITDEITKIQTKVVRLPGDSIFIQPICPSDTVVVTKVKVETISEKLVEAVNGKWKKHLLFGVLSVAALFGVGYVVRALKA